MVVYRDMYRINRRCQNCNPPVEKLCSNKGLKQRRSVCQVPSSVTAAERQTTAPLFAPHKRSCVALNLPAVVPPPLSISVHDADAPVTVFTLASSCRSADGLQLPGREQFFDRHCQRSATPHQRRILGRKGGKKVFQTLMRFSSVSRRARRRTPSDPEVVGGEQTAPP